MVRFGAMPRVLTVLVHLESYNVISKNFYSMARYEIGTYNRLE